MPGLSGSANGPVGELPTRYATSEVMSVLSMLTLDNQETSSRARSMTAASSRTQPSWSGSSSILRLRYTPRLGSAATSWLGYIDSCFGDETLLGDVRIGYKIVSKGIAAHCLSGCEHTSVAVVEVVLHVWFVGSKDFLIATTSSLVFTLI